MMIPGKRRAEDHERNKYRQKTKAEEVETGDSVGRVCFGGYRINFHRYSAVGVNRPMDRKQTTVRMSGEPEQAEQGGVEVLRL